MDSNVHVGRVGLAAALIVAGILFAAALAWLFYPGSQEVPPGRQVESSPADLQAFLREKRERLDSYGWVEREAGRIHIPIERAMQLEAQHR